MTRDSESRFHDIPRAEIKRSQIDRSYSLTTTMNEGDLVPFYIDEVLPGDTFKIQQNSLIRMATPLYPVMDNCYMDVYYFFVPARLVWEHWVNLMGENTESYWAPKTEYSIPQTTAPEGGWAEGTIADYMGIPTKISGISVSSLPFRAYARIWNEWFRDENLSQPVVQDIDDADNEGSNTGTELTDAQNGGLPLKAAKFHDYFTSCLPAPQKGDAPEIQIVNGITGTSWPVKGFTDSTLETVNTTYGNDSAPTLGNQAEGITATLGSGIGQIYLGVQPYGGQTEGQYITINDLRNAIAIQHILEADARGGTRYTEILTNQFGVTSPDARLQRTEYIGGDRIAININQVIQTGATTEISPQGNTAAMSLTTSSKHMCTYSATEHGYVLGLACIRVEHSYQQGLARMWTRKQRLDFYHPMLANLGEMAVLNREIYAQGTEADEEVFGYQEAWADYRYHPNITTGQMRSNAQQPLDAWHYADYYEEQPLLSDTWIKEGTENIDRTLAVQSEAANQFLCNFYFKQTWTRPMPIYSIPGLETI